MKPNTKYRRNDPENFTNFRNILTYFRVYLIEGRTPQVRTNSWEAPKRSELSHSNNRRYSQILRLPEREIGRRLRARAIYDLIL